MGTTPHRTILAALALALSALVHAQPISDTAPASPPTPESAFETVVIDGLKDPHRLSVARLQKAVSAVDANRNLAPSAQLRFMAIDTEPTAAPLALKLENDGLRSAIAVDAVGLFDLALIGSNEAQNTELVSNRRKGSLRIRPYVASAGYEGDRRRLGDLRLECAAYWSIRRDDLSFLQKAIVTAVGGACTSPNVSSSYPVPRKLTNAKLRHGERSIDVTLKEGGMGFWPPLYDASWPDDAVVTLTFASAASK